MRDQSKDLHVCACLCAKIAPKILEEKKRDIGHTHTHVWEAIVHEQEITSCM